MEPIDMPCGPAGPSRCARVDSHQHFWNYDPAQYPWIKAEWPIRRNFLPDDLKPLLDVAGIDACVAVQARQTVEETRWLLELTDAHAFIAGVVGWVDPRSPKLKIFSHPKLVGIRHVVQDEPDDRFLLREEFTRGIASLEDEVTYDLLIFPKQLPAAIELTRRFPKQRFVLDHMAKPLIRSGVLEPWKREVEELAKAPNVFCKISGMVTEARWQAWNAVDFRPYLDVVWEAFGENRLMAGSDWPVCLLAGEYSGVMGLVKQYLQQFPTEVWNKIMGENARRFYRLKV
jgi:L-fuconolactonase